MDGVKTADRLASALHFGATTGRMLLGTPVIIRIGNGLGDDGIVLRPPDCAASTPEIQADPKPVTTGAPDGDIILRASMLHEIGHHLYHLRSPHCAAVMGNARKEDIVFALHLLQDEQIERRLRAISVEWGRWLDRRIQYELGWALSDDQRWRQVVGLAQEIEPTTRPPIRRGGVFVSRHGFHRYWQFFYHLRLHLPPGQGTDPAVDELLMACRDLGDMDLWDLLRLARRVAALADGLDRADLQPRDYCPLGLFVETDLGSAGCTRLRERMRALQGQGEGGSQGASGWINTDPDPRFPRLEQEERLPFCAQKHAALSAATQPLVPWLKRALAADHQRRDQGDESARQGRRLHLMRARNVAVRPALDLLVAPETPTPIATHLAVMVDCSASMYGTPLDTARRLASALEQTAHGQRHLRVDVAGFDDDTLYICGPGPASAIASLETKGGTNEAAALHAGLCRLRDSPAARRLLVMIGDGETHTSSVAAVAAVQTELARQGIATLQLAIGQDGHRVYAHRVDVTHLDAPGVLPELGRTLRRALAATRRDARRRPPTGSLG